MRVVNDREEVKGKPAEQFGPWAVPLYALICAFGMTTFVFSPMTMILAHRRLSDFWPKVVALVAAVIALVLLEAAMPVVLASFIFGLFVADGVDRQVPFWKLLGQSLLVATLVGGLGLIAVSSSQGMSPALYWAESMNGLVEMMKQTPFGTSWDQNLVRGILVYEGPFLLLAGAVMSFWLSVGLAAHFEWFAKEHPYSADSLRKLKGSSWHSAAFLILFLSSFFAKGQSEYVLGGIFRFFSVIMFIYGSVGLSNFMALRSTGRGIRALVYSVMVFIGFYAVVGIGVFSPWTLRRKNRAEVLPVSPLEEAI